jgi:hypothetical protein
MAYNDSEQTVNSQELHNFMKVWSHYDPDAKGFIPKVKFTDFLYDLGEPLGFDRTKPPDKEAITYFTESLELSVYNDLMDFQFYNVIENLSKKILIDEYLGSFITSKEEEEQIDFEPVNQEF